MDSFTEASLILSNFWWSVQYEAICLIRHQQSSLLAAARQGEEGCETTTKYPDLVCIDSVSSTADIHLPDPEVALRNPLQGHEQGGGGFHGLRIR